tara:strand:- start:11676 stop:12443 length:768 start_codon:yes stop_codon:yes gene_type:complete
MNNMTNKKGKTSLTGNGMMPMLQPNKLFVTEFHNHVRYDYYLMGVIGDPDEYLDLCHAIRSCGPDDEVFLRINSPGGRVSTGNQIINAIKECIGNVVGFIESDCGSMATFIFLACHQWAVSEYAEFFCHTASGGNYGKESETFEASTFFRKQTHNRIRKDYKDFLTEDEIEHLLKGGDYYFNAEETMERMKVFSEARDQKSEDTAPESISDIIEEKVEKGISKGIESIIKKYDLTEKPKPVRKAKPKVPKITVEE